ncbi:phage protein [Vibrio fluvialis]|nr:phage protein [Vibrio fluvialis]EKO3522152.1 phage protein [Vibrio fluvialis]EKO3526479.1 phage protein [Vibrio fluvialis]EKO3930010.1 phage protein [Vibrio fluvialis]ELP3312884.1 phage protein [Vibrio fluvialis]
MKYHEMSKNYIFREFECGLTKEQTAELCFKSVRVVTSWDLGKEIPPECKRLMRWASQRELSHYPEWEAFAMAHNRMVLPTGQRITAQQLLTGIALLEIQSELEIQTSSKLLRIARALNSIKNKTTMP